MIVGITKNRGESLTDSIKQRTNVFWGWLRVQTCSTDKFFRLQTAAHQRSNSVIHTSRGCRTDGRLRPALLSRLRRRVDLKIRSNQI